MRRRSNGIQNDGVEERETGHQLVRYGSTRRIRTQKKLELETKQHRELDNYLDKRRVLLYRCLRDKGSAEAADLNRRLVEANKRIAGPFGVPGVKAAMNLTGYAAGIPRRPLCPLTADDVDTIKSILVELKVLDK